MTKKEQKPGNLIDKIIEEFDKKLNHYVSCVADEKSTIRECTEKRIKVKVFLRESFFKIARSSID